MMFSALGLQTDPWVSVVTVTWRLLTLGKCT